MRYFAAIASAVLIITLLGVMIDNEVESKQVFPKGPISLGTSSQCSFSGSSASEGSGGYNKGVGDVNGDGFDDIIISARGAGTAGEVYLIFGRGAGLPISASTSNADVTFVGTSGVNLFLSLASGAGDVNGDGYDDIIMADDYYSGSITSQGKSYLFFGRPSWKKTYVAETSCNVSFVGENANDQLGRLSTGVGDVNGDSYDDFIISSRYYDSPGGTDSGIVYLIFGKSSGWSRSPIIVNSSNMVSYHGERDNNLLGTAGYGAGIGDIDSDGYDDFVLSNAWMSDETRTNYGKVYLFYGRSSGWHKGVNVTTYANATFEGIYSDDYFSLVGGKGDVNGDSYDDMIIGAPGINQDSGKAFLYFGGDERYSGSYDYEDSDVSFAGGNKDQFGYIVGIMGDLNDDGYDDIGIGASELDFVSADVGGGYIFLGNSSFVSDSYSKSSADYELYGEATNDAAGEPNTWGIVGDFNDDGYDDIQIGARGFDPTPSTSGAGKTYIMFLYTCEEQKTTGSVKAYPDNTYSSNISDAMMGNRIFVELNGTDGDPDRVDQAFVKVQPRGETVFLPIMLRETGKNTGRYLGDFTISKKIDTFKRECKANNFDYIDIYARKDPAVGTSLYVEDWIELLKDQEIEQPVEGQEFSFGYSTRGLNEPESWQVDLGDASDWLSWDEGNLKLFGTPHNRHVGSYDISVKVLDHMGHFDSHIFTLHVENVPPKIITEDLVEIMEEEPYFNDYDCDQDGDGIISWKLECNTEFLDIDRYTGEISGMFPNGQCGELNIKVTVNDGRGGGDSTEFKLIIHDKNYDPEIKTEDINEIQEGKLYQVNYVAFDEDPNDRLSWEFESNASWLEFNRKSISLSGIPDNEEVGSYWVNVSVSDQKGGIDYHNFTLAVINTEDHPSWISKNVDLELTQNEYYSFTFLAKDPDIGDEIEYSLTTFPEIDLEIDPITGFFEWTADIKGLSRTLVGTYLLTVTVTASDGLHEISHAFNIQVIPNVGPTSELISPGRYESRKIDNIKLKWNASDPEDDDILYDLYLDQDLEKVRSLDDDSRILEGSELKEYVPEGLEIGATYYWTVIPSDIYSRGVCGDKVYTFHINSPPKIIDPGEKQIRAGEELVFNIEFMDPDDYDADKLVIRLINGSDRIDLNPLDGNFSWIPHRTETGEHEIVVELTDGKEIDRLSFKVIVLEKKNDEVKEEPEEENEGESGIAWILILFIVISLILLLVVFVFILIRKRSSDSKNEEEDQKQLDEVFD